ncbi:MAG TPA: two-component regulator propeller domain-containing protein, partial [Chitinophagaceae bacterium]
MQRKLTILACLFFCANCFAQQYPFVYYTPRDGLVNSRVRAIKQDSRGRMLFITYGGISVYDGTHFTNYSKQDGLGENLVNDAIEISPDSLLISTNTTILNTLVNGKIGVYQTVDHFCPIVNRFFKSQAGDWYVAADEGLFLLSGKKFVRLPLVYQGYDIKFLDRILQWKNFFLISIWNPENRQKLILYDQLNRKVLDVDTKNSVYNFAQDKKGRIWISCNDKIMLVDTTALKNGRISYLPLPAKYNGLLQDNSFISFDDANNLWLYARSRVVKISADFQKQVFSGEQGLKTTSLSDLFIDKEGIAWFASDGGGIVKIRNANIELLDDHPATATTTQNDTVWFSSNNIIYRAFQNERKSFVLPKPQLGVGTLYTHNQKL